MNLLRKFGVVCLLLASLVLLVACGSTTNSDIDTDTSTDSAEDGTTQPGDTNTEERPDVPHTHLFGGWCENTATCTDGGTEKRYCECGESEERDTQALNHPSFELIVVEEVLPTCIEDGYRVEQRICILCGECIGEYTSLIAMISHTPCEEAIENMIDASCTASGSYDTVVYCEICGLEIERNSITIDMKDHIYGKSVIENDIPSTCHTPGSYDTVTYCKVCGYELERINNFTDVIPHTAGETVTENEKAATCATRGSYDQVVYCSVCGEELSRENVKTDKLPHVPGDLVKERVTEPTCTEGGYYWSVRYCTECGKRAENVKVNTDPKGHTASDFIIESETLPTCTERGYISGRIVCTDCNVLLSREGYYVDMLDHTPGAEKKENVKDATCLAEGSYDIAVYCSECKAELSRSTYKTDIKDHVEGTMKTNTVKATCTEKGSYDMVDYCINCNTEFARTTYYTDELGHKSPGGTTVVESVPSTCTEDGYQLEYLYCARCNEPYEEFYIFFPKGHKASSEVKIEDYVDSTCTEEGCYYNVRYCTACGEVATKEKVVIAMKSHNPKQPVDENHVQGTCQTPYYWETVVYCRSCSCELSREPNYGTTTDHEYDGHIETKEATCTEEGYERGVEVCRFCGLTEYTFTNVIEKKPHTTGRTERVNVVKSGVCVDGGYDLQTYCSECNSLISTKWYTLYGIHNYSGCRCAECGHEILTSEGLELSLNSDGLGYTVTGIGSCTDEYISIGTYEGLPITAITSLSSTKVKILGVEMSDYVVTISSCLFDYNRTVRSVRFSESLTVIPEYTFRSCSSLESVFLPSGIERIGNCAFQECTSLTEITLPAALESIGGMAFYGCALRTIEIPARVSSILTTVFGSCYELEKIEVSADNEYFKSVDGMLYSKDGKILLTYIVGDDEIVSIPEGVEELQTLVGTEWIKELYLPEGLLRVLNITLSGLDSIEKISIPSSILDIGQPDFGENLCYNRYGDLLYLGNDIDPYVILCGTDNPSLTEVILHSNTKHVMRDAFLGKTEINRLVLNDGLITIGFTAFYMTSITEVVIPDSVINIHGAFYLCESLKTVSLGKGITLIEGSTFMSCTSLTSVTIYGMLTEVDTAAFRFCTAITDIYFAGTEEEWSNVYIAPMNASLSSATVHYI